MPVSTNVVTVAIWGPGRVQKREFRSEFCREIKLDGKCCDQSKFERCVSDAIQRESNNPDLVYSASMYNCISWARGIIKSCKKKACEN